MASQGDHHASQRHLAFCVVALRALRRQFARRRRRGRRRGGSSIPSSSSAVGGIFLWQPYGCPGDFNELRLLEEFVEDFFLFTSGVVSLSSEEVVADAYGAGSCGSFNVVGVQEGLGKLQGSFLPGGGDAAVARSDWRRSPLHLLSCRRPMCPWSAVVYVNLSRFGSRRWMLPHLSCVPCGATHSHSRAGRRIFRCRRRCRTLT